VGREGGPDGGVTFLPLQAVEKWTAGVIVGSRASNRLERDNIQAYADIRAVFLGEIQSGGDGLSRGHEGMEVPAQLSSACVCGTLLLLCLGWSLYFLLFKGERR